MTKIKEYGVVHGCGSRREALDSIVRAVEERIQDGWVPHGGISITIEPLGKIHAAQAMVRHEGEGW